jgi:hypothetical protein
MGNGTKYALLGIGIAAAVALILTVVITGLSSQRAVVIENFGTPGCEYGDLGTPYTFYIGDLVGNHARISGNWSEVKTILVYQHDHHGLNRISNMGFADPSLTLDEYFRQEDARCGLGSKISMPLEKLDPSLIPPLGPVPISTPYNFDPWRQ